MTGIYIAWIFFIEQMLVYFLKFVLKIFIFIYVYVFSLHVYLYPTCLFGACGGVKRVLDFLELEL